MAAAMERPVEGGEVSPLPRNMDDIPWYHHNLSHHVAENLLMAKGQNGSYLLRDSKSKPGDYTLSVRVKNSVKHFLVRWNGREFSFGFGKFSTVSDLLEHFSGKPVIGEESGVLTLLQSPCPREVQEPECYDKIRVHAEWGRPIARSDECKPTFCIKSKEGYLTKLGYYRHSWRTRWFVLFKSELKYYKTNKDKSALKVISLKDMSHVAADRSRGKQNHFRIITSYRTFFLYASSAQEAEDWIRVLRWKLDGLRFSARGATR